MSKLLVIFGLTGQQGSSIARTVLNDPGLSKEYRIRGITRDSTNPTAVDFAQKGVEVVTADVDSSSSLSAALKGADAVFSMTVSLYRPGGKEQEIAQGKAIADATIAAGASLLVYSTVPSASKISGGKFPVVSFDCKDEVREYIDTLPIISAFFAPGSFMQNFNTFMTPRPGEDGVLAVSNFVSKETEIPLIDISEDTGKFVGAVLADPAKFKGKSICASTYVKTLEECVQIMSKKSGKEIKYQQLPKEVYETFFPEGTSEPFVNMFSYFQEFGYYGSETKELVKWAAENARGRPTTLEEYLAREPLNI